jgi:hypothetical protein
MRSARHHGPIANPRLANGDRSEAGQDLVLRQMAVTHDAGTAILHPGIGMAAHEGRHLGLDWASSAANASTTASDDDEMIRTNFEFSIGPTAMARRASSTA